MGDYVLRRLYQALWVLIAVTFVTFFISNLLPGDPALSRAGQFATREQVETTRKRLGLDQPLHIQYVKYMQRLLSGDLGIVDHLASTGLEGAGGLSFPATTRTDNCGLLFHTHDRCALGHPCRIDPITLGQIDDYSVLSGWRRDSGVLGRACIPADLCWTIGYFALVGTLDFDASTAAERDQICI